MCALCQTVSVGAALLTGILPIATPEPEATRLPTLTASSRPLPQASIGGTTCKKVGQIRSTSAGNFRCTAVKNRRVWRRTATTTVTETTSTSTTTVVPTDQNLPKVNEVCPKIGQKVLTSYGYIKCRWPGGATSNGYWTSYVVKEPSSSLSNSYKTTPVVNTSCESAGDTFDVPLGFLECRLIAGNKLRWIQINNIKNTFRNAVSPQGIEPCMLRNDDATKYEGRSSGLKAAFPFDNTAKHGMNSKGDNEVLIVGIDFPELPGDNNLKEKLQNDVRWMKDWYRYFSNDQARFNVTTIDKWIRAPKSAASYVVTGNDGNSADSNNFYGRASQPFVDLITKEIDLRRFSTVYMIFPEGEITFDMDLVVRNYYFDIKEGKKHLNFFGWGHDLELMETLRWAYYVHETLHDFDIVMHSPGNGWPLGIGTNQSGISYALNPYEQFLLDWLPKEQIYCVDSRNLSTVSISLTPVEREDKQTKMAIVRLSSTRLIVIESHGIDKWSSLGFGDRSFPAGFYSIMAYIVDLNQVTAPPVSPDSRSLSTDEWGWAVWQKIEGAASDGLKIPVGYGKNLGDYVALLGDSFLIDGVRIKFVGTGDYETIEISKA